MSINYIMGDRDQLRHCDDADARALLSINSISISQVQVDSDEVAPSATSKENTRLGRKRQLSVSKMIILLIITEKEHWQKSELPSPPRVRPRITVAQSKSAKSVKDTEREGAQSPTMESMRQALQAQTAPSGQVVKTIRLYFLLKSKEFVVTSIFTVNGIHIKCMVYPTANVTFSELVTHARAFDAIGDCTGSLESTLMYNLRAKPKYGAFKQTIFGYVDRPALWNSTSVAIKQCFYTAPQASIGTTTGRRILYDKHTQLTKLTAELNCLRWASALMGLVYNFIDDQSMTTLSESQSFPIPKINFVKSALAISDHEVFLLEEVINEDVEGPFIKYIGNGSVKPYDFLKSEEHRRGEFLSFCQHVQFLKTKGLAFVGDFQGKHEPMGGDQILTLYFKVDDIY